MKKLILLVVMVTTLLSTSLFATNNKSLINEENSPVQFFAEYEKGFLMVTNHTIKIGSSGTLFNYVTQGGQDILFPFERFNIGCVINKKHRISILYQPLELNTVVPFEDDVKIDSKVFPDTTNMELKYGFPFWRITYSYDLMDNDDITIAIGAALQIRNASIVFKDIAGSKVRVSQNVGPVPALNFYSRWNSPLGIILSADITGLYASSAIINGANFEFEGSLLDASLRAGYMLKNNMEIFANIRFLGGSSKGTSSYSGSNWSVASSDDRYGQNNLGTLSTSIGLTIK